MPAGWGYTPPNIPWGGGGGWGGGGYNPNYPAGPPPNPNDWLKKPYNEMQGMMGWQPSMGTPPDIPKPSQFDWNQFANKLNVGSPNLPGYKAPDFSALQNALGSLAPVSVTAPRLNLSQYGDQLQKYAGTLKNDLEALMNSAQWQTIDPEKELAAARNNMMRASAEGQNAVLNRMSTSGARPGTSNTPETSLTLASQQRASDAYNEKASQVHIAAIQEANKALQFKMDAQLKGQGLLADMYSRAAEMAMSGDIQGAQMQMQAAMANAGYQQDYQNAMLQGNTTLAQMMGQATQAENQYGLSAAELQQQQQNAYNQAIMQTANLAQQSGNDFWSQQMGAAGLGMDYNKMLMEASMAGRQSDLDIAKMMASLSGTMGGNAMDYWRMMTEYMRRPQAPGVGSRSYG